MFSQDFKEFVALLQKHKAEYLIVGGYAVRSTGLPFSGSPGFKPRHGGPGLCSGLNRAAVAYFIFTELYSILKTIPKRPYPLCYIPQLLFTKLRIEGQR
jgi:hypothetical protein